LGKTLEDAFVEVACTTVLVAMPATEVEHKTTAVGHVTAGAIGAQTLQRLFHPTSIGASREASESDGDKPEQPSKHLVRKSMRRRSLGFTVEYPEVGLRKSHRTT
jgi:hypothetical protein